MCVLKLEDFLDLRFKEAQIEKEAWSKFNEVHKGAEFEYGKTFYEIASKKEAVYREALHVELVNQVPSGDGDPILKQLNDYEKSFRDGEISHSKYWIKVDEVLKNKDKNYSYKLIDNEWRRFPY